MRKRIKSFLFKNTSTGQTVAKNTFWLTVSNFGGRLIKAIIIVYAARVLGTAGYGVLSYTLTLAGFASLFIDPGVNAIVARETSKGDYERKMTILSTTFVLKLVLIAVGALVVFFIAPFFSTLPGAKALLPVAICIMAFDNIREFLSSFMRGMEKMEWEAVVFLLTNAAIVVFGFIAITTTPTPLALGWAYAAGTAVGVIAAFYVLRNYFREMVSRFSTKIVSPILLSAWPFAITGALGILLTNADILIISWMRSASDVGIYSAAIRIIQVLYLIPTVVQFSVLPLLARLARKDDRAFRAAFERIISLVCAISIPLALGGAILGNQIMRFVFGSAYAAGGLSFKILMLTMLVDYPATIISAAVFTYDRQKSLIITSVIGGISNVALDLLLIPRFGIAGSAVATLIAQTLANWYLWRTMKKLNYFKVIPKLKKIIVSGVIMAAATVLFLVLGVTLIVSILLSAAIYFFLLWAFRESLLIEVKNILLPTREQFS